MTALGGLVHRGLRRLGYDLVPFPTSGSLGAHLLALLAQLEVNCVLDVGAHRGEYGRLLRTIGYRGRIVSFEPVPESFAALRQCAARDPDWRAWPVALGRSEETRALHVTRDTAFSSFFTPNARGTGRFGGAIGIERVERVPVKRLDDVFMRSTEGMAEPRVFVKLDTQGNDVDVLESAGARLADVRALQCELPVLPIYEGIDDYVTAVDRLTRLGFVLTGIFAVSREPDLTLLEVDCVLRRVP